jgi:peptidoglycan hydrolase CwlO-like protein
MEKEQKRAIIAVAILAVLLLSNVFFITKYFATPKPKIETKTLALVSKEATPTYDATNSEIMRLQGKIWELTDENEALKGQVEAYEDMVKTESEKADSAIQELNDLQAKYDNLLSQPPEIIYVPEPPPVPQEKKP